MRFHAIQQDVVNGDYPLTRLAIEKQLAQLKLEGGDFVVCPEMSDTGWSMKIEAITGIGTVEWAETIAQQFAVWIQIGWANQTGSKAENCVSICSPDGVTVATYIKHFTCNPFGENEFYNCGTELVIVDTGDARICPMICYDLRFPELWRPAAIQGVDVFTVSSSWPLARIGHWEGLLVGRAIENQAAVVAANRVGIDSISSWGGRSMIVNEHGEVLARGSQTENESLSAAVNIELLRKNRKEFPVFEDIKEELIGKIPVRTYNP